VDNAKPGLDNRSGFDEENNENGTQADHKSEEKSSESPDV